jgi:hypothetical protein
MMGFGLPHTVILDDGELAELRSMLSEAGIPFRDTIPEGKRGPRAIPLLVTTPVRACDLLQERSGEGFPASYLHLVVSDVAETTARELLAGVPCDFVIQRPIDPDVLRLLTQRAGYEGPERRRMLRVAIGTSVELRVDDRAHEAELAQLSIGGCGVVMTDAPEEGAAVTLEFPRALTEPRRLSLSGRVLTVREEENADGKPCDVSIAFDPIGLTDRVTLRAVMAGRRVEFRPRPKSQVEPGRPASAARAPRRRRAVMPVGGDRRKLPRRIFNREILGGNEGIARVLIGSDISTRGMRIERGARFALGDVLKLAIYGGPGMSPVLLEAVVERDDDAAGWFLRFAPLGEAVEADLEKLLDSLPLLGIPEGAGSILTEVLEAD